MKKIFALLLALTMVFALVSCGNSAGNDNSASTGGATSEGGSASGDASAAGSAVLAFVPYIGFIPLTPAISLSIVHLPAIIGTLVLGFKKGMILSLAFGVLSFIRAFTPMGIADVTFQNPLIAILPRLFIAPGAYGVYKLMQKLFISASTRMAKRSSGSAGLIGGVVGTIIGVLVTIIVFSSQRRARPFARAVRAYSLSLRLPGRYRAVCGR